MAYATLLGGTIDGNSQLDVVAAGLSAFGCMLLASYPASASQVSAHFLLQALQSDLECSAYSHAFLTVLTKCRYLRATRMQTSYPAVQLHHKQRQNQQLQQPQSSSGEDDRLSAEEHEQLINLGDGQQAAADDIVEDDIQSELGKQTS